MLDKFQSFDPHFIGVVGKPKNLFVPEATQKYPLGARFKYGNRTFHYSYAGGTALIAGTLVIGAAYPLEVNKSVGTAAAIGATSIPNITTAAALLNLDGGMMIVNDNDGEGNSYEIISSKANADTGTSTDLVLRDPLLVALTTDSQVELSASPYFDLDIAATEATDHIVGIPNMAVTANYYFWLQTWGPCACLAGDTTAAGDLLVEDGTNGCVTPATVFTSNIIGVALTTGTATEYNSIFLKITP